MCISTKRFLVALGSIFFANQAIFAAVITPPAKTLAPISIFFGRAFSNSGDLSSLEGKPTEYGRTDSLFADSLCGGATREKYAFFAFRETNDPSIWPFEIIFFDEKGGGFSVPVPAEAIRKSDAGSLSFSISHTGGGESGSWKNLRKFEIIFDSGSQCLFVTIDSDSTATELVFFKRRNHWRARMSFFPTNVAPDLLTLTFSRLLKK